MASEVLIIDTESALAQAAAALAEPSEANWAAPMETLALSLPGSTPASPESVTNICRILASNSFLSTKSSWLLVYFLLTNWDWFAPADRDRFRAPLVAAFSEFGDPQGGFVVAELLGERFADADALNSFIALARTAKESVRAYIPYGLERLHACTTMIALEQSAITLLREMARDSNEGVRAEASASLRKIALREQLNSKVK